MDKNHLTELVGKEVIRRIELLKELADLSEIKSSNLQLKIPPITITIDGIDVVIGGLREESNRPNQLH